jgi:hypothetical protein
VEPVRPDPWPVPDPEPGPVSIPVPRPEPRPGGDAPAARGRKRISAARLDGDLARAVSDVQAEIRAFAARNPGVAIEISWRPADPAETGTGDGEAHR